MPTLGTRLPGFKRQRQLRAATIGEIAEAVGLDYKAVMNADLGRPVKAQTCRKLVAWLEATPVSDHMRELVEA